jgi:uncharacterized lipoprotein YehR (DUF1307 family)
MNLLLPLLQVTDETTVVSAMDAIQKALSKLGFRLLIDFVSIFVLIRLVYFPVYKKRELFFTFFIFNLVIFLICFLLNKVDLSMGAAFGLFAVFSMLRYRTEELSMKDMTYLFLVIAMGLISAVTKVKDADEYHEYILLGIINAVIIGLAYLLESKLILKKESVKTILYENIDLIIPERHADLMAEIRKRTGINVHRISIQKMDFLKDAAQIKIYYFED